MCNIDSLIDVMFKLKSHITDGIIDINELNDLDTVWHEIKRLNKLAIDRTLITACKNDMDTLYNDLLLELNCDELVTHTTYDLQHKKGGLSMGLYVCRKYKDNGNLAFHVCIEFDEILQKFYLISIRKTRTNKDNESYCIMRADNLRFEFNDYTNVFECCQSVIHNHSIDWFKELTN